MFIETKLLSFMFIIGFGIVLYYAIVKAKESPPRIRRLEALEAIDEAVGRATELGRPLHYSTGRGAITDEHAPQTMSGLKVLAYTAKLCAQYNCDLINTVNQPLVLPLSSEMVKLGYANAGKLDEFKPDQMVRFISPDQMSYAAGTMELIQKEEVAANVLIGGFYAEALLLMEAAAANNAIQIGGTARMYQIQFFVVVCDYALIGEEIFAADAYLSGDPAALGALRAQDYGKLFCVACIVTGSLLRTLKIDFIHSVLSKYGN